MPEVMPVPNPRVGFVYAEAAIDVTNPDNVRYRQQMGYRKLGAKEAVNDLGYEDRSIADGGFIDKTNNSVSNGRLVKMECPVETYIAYRKDRHEAITFKGRKIDDEFKEEVGHAAYDVKEALS